MKWLILISIIMVGCILEPVPENETTIDVSGDWVDLLTFHILEVNGTFKGQGDTLSGNISVENHNYDQRNSIYYRDTIEIPLNDSVSVYLLKFNW